MYLQLCTPEQLQNIYAEFNITKESLENDTSHLMEWMEKQPHLPKVKDREWLSRILILSKNSLAVAKKKLDEYYRVRAMFPELLTNRDPNSMEMKKVLKCTSYVALPKLTSEGDRILVWKIFDPNEAQFLTGDQFAKMKFFHIDLIKKVDDARKIIQIFDLENMSFSFAMMMGAAVRKMSLPSKAIGLLRTHSIIVLHINSMLEPIFNTMKMVLIEKLQKRITFRGKNTDLSDVLPKDLLPSDYGGSGKSLNEYLDDYLTSTKEFGNWFIEEDSMKADLSKIPSVNGGTQQHLFGTDGSFRKLMVD